MKPVKAWAIKCKGEIRLDSIISATDADRLIENAYRSCCSVVPVIIREVSAKRRKGRKRGKR
jgi:hypothetical protein